MSGFVNSSSVFQKESVLTEVACEGNGKCNVDQRAFKGITARSLARAARFAPFASEKLDQVLQASAKAAAFTCSGDEKQVKCGTRWYGQNKSVESGESSGLGEVFSVMEAVQVLLYPQAQVVSNGTSSNSTGVQTGSPSQTSGTVPPTASGNGAAGNMNVAWGVMGLVGLISTMLL